MTKTKSPFNKEHPYHKINEFLHSNVFATPFIQSAIDYYCQRCTDEEIDRELKDSTIVAPQLWKELRDNAKKTI